MKLPIVLLVEDNPADTELTERALHPKNTLDYELVHVEDGEEALDFIFATGKYAHRDVNNLPDVILLDLNLPKVSGIDVLKKIRSTERTSDIPVIVLTSSNDEKNVLESYNLGIKSYIVKPVEFEKFLKAVKDLGLYRILIDNPYR